MKVGILGLGSIGMRHARNLQMLGHNIIGYDTDMKKCLALSGVLHERDELIETSDAIIIATPTCEHANDLLACIRDENIRDGKKAVCVEKPLCSLEHAHILKNYGSTSRFFVAYMLRFNPCVKAAKNWIDQDYIGKPLWASFICGQFNDKPDYLRDGVLINWSHEIDLALYLLGPAKVVAASVHTVDGKDDIADFVLQHESGARSTIHLDYVTKNEIREAWIVGSEKNIGMDLLGRRNSMGKVIQEFGGSWNDDYIDEMAAFVERCQGKETLGATGEDGLRVLEICQQVRQLAGLEE